MKNENIYPIFVGALGGLFLILIWEHYFKAATTVGIVIMMILLSTLLFLFSWLIYIILKSRLVTNYFGKVTQSIFFISLICIFILTTLLGLRWIQDYFSSIYILLGSIIVTVLGLYLDNKLDVEKEQRKLKRIILALNATIKENKNAANEHLHDIEKVRVNLKILKIGFWDTFNSSIIEVDLDPIILKDLLSIKELTLEINQMIIKQNKLASKEDLYDSHAPHMYELFKIQEGLKEKLNSLIQDSEKYLEKADKL